jgi:dynactin 1
MDQWFYSIRPNEFGKRDCSLDLVGYVAELEHAPCFIASGVDLGAAELQLGLALAFDYKLNNFAASVGLARHGIME